MSEASETPAPEAAPPEAGRDVALIPAPDGPVAVPLTDWTVTPEIPDWATSLDERERAWLDAYIVAGFNANAASREVGIAESSGGRLRRDPRVIRALEGMLRESGLARSRVLEELGALAFSSLSDAVNWKGGKMVVRDAAELPDSVKRALTRIECDPETGAVTKIAMDLKGQSLGLLAKALRLVGPDLAIGVSGDQVKVVLSAQDQLVL